MLNLSSENSSNSLFLTKNFAKTSAKNLTETAFDDSNGARGADDSGDSETNFFRAYKKLNHYLQNEALEEKIDREEKHENLKDFILSFLQDFEVQTQDRLVEEFLGWGPLKALINDSSIDEIIINGVQKIAYEKEGQLYVHTDRFFSEHSLSRFVDLVSKAFFKAISFENPSGDGDWLDFRVHIISPPLSPYYTLCLRRHGGQKIKSLSALKDYGSLSAEHEDFLHKILQQKNNILISGATSSGKTTFIQCLLNEIKNERCILLEDAKELQPPNVLSSQILCPSSRDEVHQHKFSMADLVKESLRMRPDRLVLGEARGSEAKDYIQALSTGHRGCMASIHAAHPQDALLRLECLILQGAPEWSTRVVRQLISSGLDYIIQLEKDSQGKRRITDIQKICGLEDQGLLLEPLDFF